MVAVTVVRWAGERVGEWVFSFVFAGVVVHHTLAVVEIVLDELFFLLIHKQSGDTHTRVSDLLAHSILLTRHGVTAPSKTGVYTEADFMHYCKSLYSLGSHDLNAVGLLGVNQDKLIDLFGGGNHYFGGYWRQVG